MATLVRELRGLLERTIDRARTEATKAATAALAALGVQSEIRSAHLSDEENVLRLLLREKMRQLGDFALLADACAYEQWHRMLFARFLAENDLLIHPQYDQPVTLDECAELAADEGEPDGWMVAAKYAAAMLPGIFRTEDPLQRVRFAAEGRQALEAELAKLPPAVFTSDDGLGWVYQFWQAQKKKEVNASGRKIGGADIPPVTQLFTEPYMVEFLLHNTLGAWWAGRHPDDDLIETFTYLRTDEEGKPIAGTFPGWPGRAADLRVLDPCCGSGHFLVAAFGMLHAMRMREEGLGAAEAGDAVLRDNLFGLEIDARCTEIAAFAIALAAWKEGGYRRGLPVPNVACSGIPVGERMYNWTQLADGNSALEASLRTLYETFQKAPDLGSLIDPQKETVGPIFAQSLRDLPQRLEQALKWERIANDPAAAVFGDAAAGAARAGSLLVRRDYHLVITNPPFLGTRQQDNILRDFLATRYADSRADTATAFLERCRSFCAPSGTYAMVTPQNWLFLAAYKKLRERCLKEQNWHLVIRLGTGAFQTITGGVVSVSLLVISNAHPSPDHTFMAVDAIDHNSPQDKADFIRVGETANVKQSIQVANPDSRIVFEQSQVAELLSVYADGLSGIQTGDYPRFGRCFWEIPEVANGWEYEQGCTNITQPFGGREQIILWEKGNGQLRKFAVEVRERLHDSDRRGSQAWGKWGVAVSSMTTLQVSLYTGDLFDNNTAVVLPHRPEDLPAIWAFCSSPQFNGAVRRIDQKLNVTNSTLVKVPFDLDHWQKVADEEYPNGLPKPLSIDSTQWLFKGYPVGSTDPLQIGIARLLGYRWPEQGKDDLNHFADADGIVCLPAVRGEQPVAERLRALLAAAYGEGWTATVQDELLAAVGYGGKGLDAWLRDGFWPQHCARFHNRPFIWHIWDGRRDGFAALVNYHILDRQKLEKLAYTYLGDWLTRQRAAMEANEPGADLRVAAAEELQRKLALILDGEPPYDIYVRWKPLYKQPIGWEPDLNDGVRLNIHPFVEAGVLRGKFTINWNKDRGTDPPSAPNGPERINDRHLTRAEKEAARKKAGAGVPS